MTLTRAQIEDQRRYRVNLIDAAEKHPECRISPAALADAREYVALCDLALVAFPDGEPGLTSAQVDALQRLGEERATAIGYHEWRILCAQAKLANSLRVSVLRMSAALEPFANFARGFGDHGREDGWVLIKSPSEKRMITMRDVRVARDAVDGPSVDQKLP